MPKAKTFRQSRRTASAWVVAGRRRGWRLEKHKTWLGQRLEVLEARFGRRAETRQIKG